MRCLIEIGFSENHIWGGAALPVRTARLDVWSDPVYPVDFWSSFREAVWNCVLTTAYFFVLHVKYTVQETSFYQDALEGTRGVSISNIWKTFPALYFDFQSVTNVILLNADMFGLKNMINNSFKNMLYSSGSLVYQRFVPTCTLSY